jgi:hypothetical protein
LTGVGAYDPYQAADGIRAKVFMLNDSAGDPDGLFAVAHAVLSRSTQVVGLVGTRGEGVTNAKAKHDKILELAGVTDVPSYTGADTTLTDTTTPIESDGARALVLAAKDYTPPTGNAFVVYPKLFVTVGGGLTDVASAILMDPTIVPHITLVWIGGCDYKEVGGSGETNTMIDLHAANVVFDSGIEIWQVPRNAYWQCYVSMTELRRDVYPYGELGRWLFDSYTSIDFMPVRGETWVMGDNPLVLLTALGAWYGAASTSGVYHDEEARLFNPDGSYNMTTPNPISNPRQIRVYDILDTRTMFADFFAKIQGKFPL